MNSWKEKFYQEHNPYVEQFNTSTGYDRRFWKQDIEGSIAHARMLNRQGIITEEERDLLISCLQEIAEEELSFAPQDEDIHAYVDRRLIEKAGEIGKKINTGRSRNDQVVLDFRMYQKEQIRTLDKKLAALLEVLYHQAKDHQKTILPGYTHMQKAQPVTLAHHLLAYYNMFHRDRKRFASCFESTDSMPLGAGALAGVSYPVDREFLKEELGFHEICSNSIDAVSDRDFALEFLSCTSITMMHLSRLCEELVIWSSPDMGYVKLGGIYSIASTILPTKKNPDLAELIRGKTGRVYGDMLTLFSVMKGIPLAYDRDMQEDKEPVFDAADTLTASLDVMAGMLASASFQEDRMEASAKDSFMSAIDAADYLASRGVPYKDSQSILGEVVLYCVRNGKKLQELSLKEWKNFSSVFEEDIFETIDMTACIQSKVSEGSTSFESVACQLRAIEEETGFAG